MSPLRHLQVVVIVLACACSENNVPPDPSSGATGGSAGGGGSSAGSGGSAGAPHQCAADGPSIEVVLDPNPIGLVDQEWDTTGVITTTSKNEFSLDTCAPNSACAPTFQKVTVKAPGMVAVLPVGAFVRLHLVQGIYNNNSTATTFSVRNVPTWNGEANPVSTTERWYLLTSDESLEHPDAPFEVSSVELQCPSESEGGVGQAYEVIFTDPGGASTQLAHSQPTTLMLGGQTWDVQVLRAFRYYGFDRPIPFSWYAESVD